jgi:ABC-type uncharacterized transport system involved in gliding motility auxiliary subunit
MALSAQSAQSAGSAGQGLIRRQRRALALCALLSGLLVLQCLRLAERFVTGRMDLSAEGLASFAPQTKQLLAELPDLATVEAYFTGDLEHAALALLRARLVDQLRSLEALAGGRLAVRFFDPSRDSAARLAASERYRLKPIDVDAVAGATRITQEVFLGLVVKLRGRQEVLPLVVPDSLELGLLSALRRLSRNRAPRIGLVSDVEFLPGLAPLRQSLAGRFEFETLNGLDQGLAVPTGLDFLLVAAGKELPARTVFELERYLANGGALLIAADRSRVVDRELSIRGYESGLEDWLKRLGVELSGDLCWDLDNAAELSNPRLAYPLMLDLRQGNLDPEHPLSARLPAVMLQWASPLRLLGTGLLQPFLWSSTRAFAVPLPDKLGFEAEPIALYSRQLIASAPAERLVLAVAGSGAFPAPSGAVPPVLSDSGEAVPAAAAPLEPSTGRAGRLVLVGDANWLLPIDGSGRPAAQNLALFENAADWLVADETLLALRARRAEPRELRDFLAEVRARQGLSGPAGAVQRARGELDAAELRAVEAAQARRQRLMLVTGLVLLLLPGLLIGLAWQRRRAPVRLSD